MSDRDRTDAREPVGDTGGLRVVGASPWRAQRWPWPKVVWWAAARWTASSLIARTSLASSSRKLQRESAAAADAENKSISVRRRIGRG